MKGFAPLTERPWKGVSFLVLEAADVVVEPAEVRLPYCEPTGAVRYWRVKRGDGREWFAPKPTAVGGLLPFGLETLPREPEDAESACLFLTEGESDCLAIREAFAEWARFPGGVYAIGLPGAGSWRPAWRGYLERFRTILIVPDGDPAGDRMAVAVRRNLRWARLVMLDEGQDARSLLQAGGAAALLPFLEGADRRWRIEVALKLSGPDPASALGSFLSAFEDIG